MRRRLLASLIGCLVLGGLGLPVAWAQTDLSVHQFFLPASNTSGWRVHTSRTTMNVTLQGAMNAAGGYKVPLTYAHPNYALVASTAVSVPVAGSFLQTSLPSGYPTSSGVLWQPMPYSGSVIGVSIAASSAVTARAAHAEALILTGTGLTTKPTGLTAVIGFGLGQTQYNTATQARGTDWFAANDLIGCRFTVDAGFTPTNTFLICTVHAEY